MKRLLIIVGIIALASVGAASAYAVGNVIWLRSGHCRSVHRQRVCARKVGTVTVTKTVPQTVYPSAAGKTFSGVGGQLVAPFTLSQAATVTWTVNLDAGANEFVVQNGLSEALTPTPDPNAPDLNLDNNGGAESSGTGYLTPGDYELYVMADGAWSITIP